MKTLPAASTAIPYARIVLTVIWQLAVVQPAGTSTTLRVSSATKTSPAASTATASGCTHPLPTFVWQLLLVQPAGIFTTVLRPKSATSRSPAAFTPKPTGLELGPGLYTTVGGPPVAGTSTTSWSRKSPMNTLPNESTATPNWLLRPRPLPTIC